MMPPPAFQALVLVFILGGVMGCASGGLSDVPEATGVVAEAGLFPEDAETLRELGVPILVPTRTGAFEVSSSASADTYGASYRIDYRRASDGACFTVEGVTEGVGGPVLSGIFTEVAVPALNRTVRLYKASDNPQAPSAQVWGAGTVLTDFIEVRRVFVRVASRAENGCKPLSLEAATPIVASLTPLPGTMSLPLERLPPVHAPSGDLGPFRSAPDALAVAEKVVGSDPETAAREAFALEGPEAGQLEMRVLSRSERRVVLLVTRPLLDDSVRAERLRLVYVQAGSGSWMPVEAERQVRCHDGRGHADWGTETCV